MLLIVTGQVNGKKALYQAAQGGYVELMQVVINADDVGLHPATTRAVAELSRLGVVTSASLAANGGHLEAASFSGHVSIGVHLDVLRGRPVSHWQHVSSLCDENGSFLINPAALFRKYANGKVLHSHVEMEWAAQIERVLDFGVRPSHLSSHKHVHGWPSLAGVAVKLAKRYGIRLIRKPIECSEIAKLDKTGFPSRFQSVCGFFDREADGVDWTAGFVSMGAGGSPVEPAAVVGRLVDQQLRTPESGIWEILCTPGMTKSGDPPIPQYCDPPSISAQWMNDYHSLQAADWLGTLQAAGVELVAHAG